MSTKAQPPTLAIPRYIRRRELAQATGLSEATLFREVTRGNLPPPVRLSPGRVAWPEDQIKDWLASRRRVA